VDAAAGGVGEAEEGGFLALEAGGLHEEGEEGVFVVEADVVVGGGFGSMDLSRSVRSRVENMREVCMISHCKSLVFAVSSIGRHFEFRRGIFQITG
jgi:hypothetical protein